MKNIILYLLFVLTAAGFIYAESADAYDQRIFEAQQKLEELGYDPGNQRVDRRRLRR